MAIVFGAMTAGQSGAMAPDFQEALAAGRRIRSLFGQKGQIEDEKGGLTPESCSGNITFRKDNH